MKRQLINEVKRFQELAGIDEMHVDSYGDLISDEEQFKRIFYAYKGRLRKALKARQMSPENIKAHDYVKLWLETIAEKLGLDSTLPFMENEMFSGEYSPDEALAYAEEMFRSMLEDEGRLEEDDYDIGTPSGDTDSMNIAEDDFSDTSRGLDNTPLP
jgi:hypothetical protein